jgi:hypothetical protein
LCVHEEKDDRLAAERKRERRGQERRGEERRERGAHG